MTRQISILILSLTVLSPIATAQDRVVGGHLGTANQQQVCRSDVLRHCSDVQAKGDNAMADCLKANAAKLKPACRHALEQGR